MNRKEFMDQLEKLLSDISEDERREALDYYESYFDEAGEAEEASVIQKLGSSHYQGRSERKQRFCRNIHRKRIL